jgi:hypothetical protein
MEFPGGGGPYLFYQNLHAAPGLFHWSTELAFPWQGWDGPVGHVDPWGRFHATTPGSIYAKAVPRGTGGRGFGLAQFIVLPPLDSIIVRVSRDTVAVGDTLTASYMVVARGAPLPMPTIHRFAMVPDDNTLTSIADSGLHTPLWTQRLRAAHSGTVSLEIRLGHHAASHLIVVH